MNDTYEHEGQELNRPIAEKLILELFAGKTAVKKADIKSTVDRVHTERGGKLSNRVVNPCTDALKNLRDQGKADNPQRGFWSIFSVKISREIFDIIEEIANLSAEGGYIYRGEPEHYEKVSSALYRERLYAIQKAGLEGELVDFDIEAVENEILDQVKRFIPPDDVVQDFSILTQLQHYGSPTNLIDFTTDFHIALFFACDSQREEHGRVIVQKRDLVSTEEPSEPRHRVTTQRSVFVQPKQGYIDPNEAKYEVVNIPSKLKAPMLEYLRNTHGISTEILYNDIHGYIRNRGIHKSAYSEFFIALTYQTMANEKPTEKSGLLDKAIVHYSQAIKLNPDYASAYINRGATYLNQERYELALEDFDRVIELDPDYFLAYSNRANVYFKHERYELALEDCNKTIELDPDYSLVYCIRGDIYLKQERYELALEDYNKAIELASDYVPPYINRGDIYLKQERYELALEDYNKAIELASDYVPPYINRGAIYQRQERYELALEDFDRVIELDPENTVAYYNRGFTLLQLQRRDEVFPNWDKALQIIYDSQESHSDFENVYARRVDDDNLPEVAADAPQEYRLIVESIKKNLRNIVKDGVERGFSERDS